MIEIPRPEDVRIQSWEEAGHIIRLLLAKIHQMEERKIHRDQGFFEEIGHLRQETREGFEKLTKQMGKNTLAIKALDKRMESVEKGINRLDNRMESVEKGVKTLDITMKGGFDNIGKILQEISNKLDD